MQNSEIDFFQQVGELSQDVYFVYDAAKGSFKYLSPAFENHLGPACGRSFEYAGTNI